MASQGIVVPEKLKRVGYSKSNRVRIYGQEFDLVSDPVTMHEQLIFVDGVERRSGETGHIRIPLPIVRMVLHDTSAA